MHGTLIINIIFIFKLERLINLYHHRGIKYIYIYIYIYLKYIYIILLL